ncbi:diacylglycerol kinase epsilon isoform X1 [Ostrinia furnacalis]|uniref:diacylglycerol kinase epsilon isoform X1 n=1 Tax=Ostrinia furnacalis TaxID=93504 RepID=UPI001038C819|nr:diacylglycerol kinase epsilon isoform X1 [Ostrinia furnacalis]
MENIVNLNDVFFNCYFLIGGLFLSYLVYKIFYVLFNNNNYIQINYKSRGHTWRSILCNKSIPYNIYCTTCGKLMLHQDGLFCECCGVSACKSCCRAVDKRFRCKAITWPSDKAFYHHWVDVGSFRTQNADNSENGPKKFFCCWCQKIKLSYLNALSETEECNFHRYRDIIIPPTCVQVEKGAITSIKPLLDDNWEPLIIFANRKSGSNRSDEVLSLFRGLLNPIQVVDISTTSPESVVRWLPPRCRILAAGGDGTVAWILNSLLAAGHMGAAVGILPMGTGNDLSRVLGWGPGCGSHLDAHSIITSIKQANEQVLDRWKVTITPRRGRLGRARERVVFAYNYASIGVDAQVALDFHRARSQFLHRYASRMLNYVAYAWLGATRAWDAGACDALERRLAARVDGAELALPPLQALVVLNIPSWGAGVDLWSMGNEGEVEPQRIDDGKIEVVGISSSIHIARLQCGLAEPYRFTQGSKVKIELNGTCAMQVDGEPWMQGPATVRVARAGQCRVLRAASARAAL